MLFRLLLSLLILTMLPASASATSALPDPLKIVISNDTFPYMFADDQGNAAGLVVDYWHEIARRENISVQFVMADWNQTLDLLQQGQVHLHGGIAGSRERERQYQLGNTGINIYTNMFVRWDMPAVTKLSELTPFAIGVVDRSSQISVIEEKVPEAILIRYANVTAMYDAALEGKINVFAGLDRLAQRYANFAPLAKQFPLYRKLPLQNIALSYATTHNDPIFAALQRATAPVEQRFLDRLERRWLGENVDEDTLLLGVAINNPPYTHVSNQGEAQGLFVDLWRQWAVQTDSKIAFVPDTSYQNIQNLKKGRIDALISFPDNNLQAQGIMAAYQIYDFASNFFTLKQNPQLTADAAFTVGVYANASYVDELRRRYPNASFVRYRQLTEMLQATISGQIAGFFGAAAIIPQRLQQLNQADLFIAQADTQVQSPMYSLVRAGDEQLAERIRSGFARLPLDTFIQIESDWVKPEALRYFTQFRVKAPLSEQERDWLNLHPTLRVAMLADWAPMEFADDAGNPAGVTVDMFALLSKRLNVEFDIQLYQSFERMLEDLKQKKIDLITNVSELEERRQYARFTDEFWSTEWAVISAFDAPNLVSTTELKGKKVAIYQDYQLAQHLQRMYPQIQVLAVDSLRAGLALLQQNKVDFVIDSVQAASETLRQTGFLHLKAQILEDLPSFPSLIAVRDDYTALPAILNKGLRSISKEEREQLYKKWFSFQVSRGLNKAQLHQMMWQIGGAVAVLLAFIIVWNLSLRREVTLRRKAEQQMRFMATHDDLTKLPNRSLVKERIEQALLQHARHNEPLALLFIDLDGFKEVNDQYGHDAGDELLLKLAQLLQSAVRKSDTVARFGGDEFVILLTGLLHRDDAAIVAQKILACLAQPLILSVGQVQVGASIGIAVYPEDGTDSRTLLKVADSLMYRIKQQGKNHYCFSKAVF